MVRATAAPASRALSRTQSGLIGAAIVFAGFFAYAFLAPTVYRTSAVIGIDAGKDTIVREPLQAARRLREALLDFRTFGELANERTPKDASAAEKAEVAQRLRSAIEVDSADGRLFMISFRDPDATRAERDCNRLAARAVELTSHLFAPNTDLREAPDPDRDARVDKLVALLSEHPILIAEPAASGDAKASAETAVLALRAERARIGAQLAAASSASESDNPYGGTDADPAQLRRRLAEIDRTLAARSRAASTATEAKVSPELRAQWQAALGELTTAQARAPIASAPLVSAHVVMAAKRPSSPIEPNRKLILFLGAVMAFGIGLGAAALAGRAAPRTARRRSTSRPTTSSTAFQDTVRAETSEPAPPRTSDSPPAHPTSSAPPPALITSDAALTPTSDARPTIPSDAPAGKAASSSDAAVHRSFSPMQKTLLGGSTAAPAVAGKTAGSNPPSLSRTLLGGSAAPSGKTPSSNPPPLHKTMLGGSAAPPGPSDEKSSSRPPQAPPAHFQRTLIDDRGPLRVLPPTRTTQILGTVPTPIIPERLAARAAAEEEREARAELAKMPTASLDRSVTLDSAASAFVEAPLVSAALEAPSTERAPVQSGPLQPQRAVPLDARPMTPGIEARPVAAGWRPDPSLDPTLRKALCDELVAARNDDSLVLAICGSSGAGAEKSKVAAEVALALSEAGQGRVLLVEGNLQRPTVHRLMRVEMPMLAGFSQQLQALGTSQQARSWLVIECSRSLHVLAEGLMRAPEMIVRPEFVRCFQDLRRAYRFVVVDGPLLSETTACRAVDKVIDGAVVVHVDSQAVDLGRVSASFPGKRVSSVSVAG